MNTICPPTTTLAHLAPVVSLPILVHLVVGLPGLPSRVTRDVDYYQITEHCTEARIQVLAGGIIFLRFAFHFLFSCGSLL